jgi:hypothetical protein
MNASLVDLRNRTCVAFVELGRAPMAGELGGEHQVRAGWRELHEAHALVLDPATDEIRMANPFSAVRRRTGWRPPDAGGMATAPGTRSAFRSPSASTGESSRPVPTAASRTPSRWGIASPIGAICFFHCLVPAAHWWDDIVFT